MSGLGVQTAVIFYISREVVVFSGILASLYCEPEKGGTAQQWLHLQGNMVARLGGAKAGKEACCLCAGQGKGRAGWAYIKHNKHKGPAEETCCVLTSSC